MRGPVLGLIGRWTGWTLIEHDNLIQLDSLMNIGLEIGRKQRQTNYGHYSRGTYGNAEERVDNSNEEYFISSLSFLSAKWKTTDPVILFINPSTNGLCCLLCSFTVAVALVQCPPLSGTYYVI